MFFVGLNQDSWVFGIARMTQPLLRAPGLGFRL